MMASRFSYLIAGLIVSSLVLSGALVLGDEKDKGGQVRLGLEKGQALEFLVKRESKTEAETPGGDFRSNTESEAAWRVELDEKKDGEAVLKVTLASLKAKGEGRGEPWSFDSSKKEEGGEAGEQFRQVLGKALTVKVREGKAVEVSGLPEPERGGGGQGGRGGFRAREIVGRRAVERELELILASPVLGQALEAGKEYRPAERAAADDGGGERRRGRGFMGADAPRLVFKFEEKADGPAARFSLAPAAPERREGDGDQPRPEVKLEGKATVSLKDGLLLKLECQGQSRSQFERDGQTFKSHRTFKHSIERKSQADKKPREEV